MQEKDRDAPKIGIIGGTGVYDSGLLSDHQEVKVHTPFGESSDIPVIGRYSGRDGRGKLRPPGAWPDPASVDCRRGSGSAQ